MKSLLSATLMFTALGAVAPVSANADLAQKKNCMGCHTVARKISGPAFKDVAARYAGQGDAVDRLTKKVLAGGSGAWGPLVMPPMKEANPAVSEAEARTLVQWILTLK